MCDTMVAVPPTTADGAVWFAKNSDREPGEAQLVEHLPARFYSSPAALRCTYLEIPQVKRTYEVLLSRPFWMWGAEMGANEYGVAIGNEAVFTRLPVERTGLTGMDLLRLALERATCAREALELITHLIARYGQGGYCGYRHKKFRYHNSFIIADPNEAWVLETAGPFWVAERARGIRTISNVLTIGREFDLISPEAFPYARSQGWCRAAADFDFARCFGDPFYGLLSGGQQRRACTWRRLNLSAGKIGLEEMFAALRDHNGLRPEQGWRLQMPCAHASWWPARQSGQTTGSMVSRLQQGRSQHWLTGTSSPCLSVFKPVVLGGQLLMAGPQPGAGFDPATLFWRHERLHRLVLRDYLYYKGMFESDRSALEARIVQEFSEQKGEKNFQCYWDKHWQAITAWSRQLAASRPKRSFAPWFHRYWRRQQKLDQDCAAIPP